jgi:hypothetical protein
MKTSNPYGANDQVKVPPETINNEQSKAGSKAKARYPHPHIPNQPGGGGGTSGSFRKAYMPNGSPSGA